MSRPDPVQDEGLTSLATRLATAAGRPAPRQLTRLAGGRNNQVYRIDTDGEPLILKLYFSHPDDRRDRLKAEWSFIIRAFADGLRSVPEPLAQDTAARAALYRFAPGRKLAAHEITADHVGAAAGFIAAINTRPAADMDAASESCFSIADHLAIVERRLARLVTLDASAPRVDEAAAFVARDLRPAWEQVKAHVAAECRALGFDPDRPLAPGEQRLSPSDFGFHNALADGNGRLTFLDFEYAGRDDPAKLTVDFICQPEIPVPAAHRALWRERLAASGVLDAAASARSSFLLDACRIKWICIMLNDFLPVGDARRAFADGNERDFRCATQLSKAARAIGELAA